MKTVSLCMIVKNEADNLRRCLDSIKECVDEIIVVDTGSEDDTIEIARSYGAVVYEHEWNNDFSEARNLSLKYATKDLILIMDADDELCSKDKDKLKDVMNSLDQPDILYYFGTLNFNGDHVDESNISMNLNPRLFCNHAGFHYEGRIHEQLLNHQVEVKHVLENIRIYHYGYLYQKKITPNKRKRNMTLLTQQLKEEPEDAFALFNLGNEYVALGEYDQAITYYEKSYQHFNPNHAFNFFLIVRMVMLYIMQNRYQDAIPMIQVGIKHYPDATDLYYYYGSINYSLGRVTLAERALKKCLELGETIRQNQFVYGTGSFKAKLLLAHLYEDVKDYTEAFKYYNEALALEPSLLDALAGMSRSLKKQNRTNTEFIEIMDKIFTQKENKEVLMAELCYQGGFYEDAMQYLIIAEEKYPITPVLQELRLKTLLCLGQFQDILDYYETASIEEPYVVNFLKYVLVSSAVLQRLDTMQEVLQEVSAGSRSESEKIILKVDQMFLNMAGGKECEILSEDKDELRYTGPIFELLELLIASKQMNLFYTSLSLLNLISDESVLIQLGKLYLKYDYAEMGKSEFIHSIKEFSRFDNEMLLCLMVK